MASAVTNLLGGSIVDGVAKIIGLFKVDPTKALEASTEITKITMQMQADAVNAVTEAAKMQAQINLEEAKSASTFVAGWRPAIGWACAGAFAYTYICQPLLGALCAIAGHPIALPSLDIAGMMPVLLGMLGLGALRSYDKTQANDGGKGKATG